MTEGEELYGIFCIHCHGESGDGQGSVITNGNGKFPTPGPYKPELTAGEIFYTITYGKNAMGSHASQVNPVERWKIVHYVEGLMGKEQGEQTLAPADAEPMVNEGDPIGIEVLEAVEEAVEVIDAEH